MDLLLEGDEILVVNTVKTDKQTAIVRTHYDFIVHLDISFAENVFTVECRYPVIEDTEWQGQIIEDECRSLFLRIDDSEPLEITVINGTAKIPLEFEAPGTYLLQVSAPYSCEPAKLEVTV